MMRGLGMLHGCYSRPMCMPIEFCDPPLPVGKHFRMQGVGGYFIFGVEHFCNFLAASDSPEAPTSVCVRVFRMFIKEHEAVMKVLFEHDWCTECMEKCRHILQRFSDEGYLEAITLVTLSLKQSDKVKITVQAGEAWHQCGRDEAVNMDFNNFPLAPLFDHPDLCQDGLKVRITSRTQTEILRFSGKGKGIILHQCCEKTSGGELTVVVQVSGSKLHKRLKKVASKSQWNERTRLSDLLQTLLHNEHWKVCSDPSGSQSMAVLTVDTCHHWTTDDVETMSEEIRCKAQTSLKNELGPAIGRLSIPKSVRPSFKVGISRSVSLSSEGSGGQLWVPHEANSTRHEPVVQQEPAPQPVSCNQVWVGFFPAVAYPVSLVGIQHLPVLQPTAGINLRDECSDGCKSPLVVPD